MEQYVVLKPVLPFRMDGVFPVVLATHVTATNAPPYNHQRGKISNCVLITSWMVKFV